MVKGAAVRLGRHRLPPGRERSLLLLLLRRVVALDVDHVRAGAAALHRRRRFAALDIPDQRLLPRRRTGLVVVEENVAVLARHGRPARREPNAVLRMRPERFIRRRVVIEHFAARVSLHRVGEPAGREPVLRCNRNLADHGGERVLLSARAVLRRIVAPRHFAELLHLLHRGNRALPPPNRSRLRLRIERRALFLLLHPIRFAREHRGAHRIRPAHRAAALRDVEPDASPRVHHWIARRKLRRAGHPRLRLDAATVTEHAHRVHAVLHRAAAAIRNRLHIDADR